MEKFLNKSVIRVTQRAHTVLDSKLNGKETMRDLSTYAYHMSCILRVLIYIEEHLNETLELEELAKIARISPYYFHRLFRVYLNETVADYVKRLRLQRAAQHLQYSKSSITDIALEIGYETPSSFTKVFNQVMGQSPSQYRKAMQPLLKAIMERTKSSQEEKSMLEPQYINREDEEILFTRQTGDYNKTPDTAFSILKQFLAEKGIDLPHLKAFYGIALDDQHIVERTMCRFDACVSLKSTINGEGEVGKKTLRGGHFAVFTHHGKGTPDEIEATLDNILRVWYPSLQEESLGDSAPFFEFVHCLDKNTPEDQRQTNIYIPLKKMR
jgi:AraC family transcriptional regulator